MLDRFPERRALEELWLNRQARVHSARARTDALHRASPNSDYNQAVREETLALSDYRRVLSIFSQLVLDGTIPNRTE